MNKLNFNVVVCNFLLIVSFLSCGTEKKEMEMEIDDKNTIILTIKPEFKNITPVSELVDSVHFIKLETTESSLVSKVAKILFTDSLLFLHDAKTRTVLIFDKQGKFKNKISKIGRGPGEYIDLIHVLIDSEKERLALYDAKSKKLIYYSYTGELIKEITKFPNNNVVHDLINLPDGNFICYYPILQEETKYNALWLADSLGNYIRPLYIPERQYPIIYNEFYNYLYDLPEGGTGLACADINDIYHYKNDSLTKYLSYELNQKTSKQFPNMEKTKENYTRSLTTFEKGKYIITQWLDENRKPFVTIYSKENKKVISSHGINYNTTEIPTIFGVLTNSNLTEALVSIVYAETIKDDLTSKYTSETAKDNLQNLLKGMSEDEIMDMNPIIQIMYLKK